MKTISNQSTVSSYQYNGLGHRLSQTVNGNTTNFTLDINSSLTQVLSDGANSYIYGLGRIAQVQGGATEYFLPDALGSARQLTDQNGSVTYSSAFDPFGAQTQSAGTAQTPYGFTGEYTTNGLIHLRAREYAPGLGRFLTRDPFAGNTMYPASLHGYAYAGNNPVLYTDPSGECFDPITLFICVAAAGALIGAGANVAYQLHENSGNWDCVDWGDVAMWGGGGAVAGLTVFYALPVLAASPDTAFDLASLIYDVYTGDVASFALDAMSLMMPGVTGLGYADNAYDAYRASEYSSIAYRSSDEVFSGFNRAFPKQSEQAAKMMEDAAKASNIELNRFVDRVVFDPAENAPYFRVRDGERIIGIDVKSLKETREMQLLIGSHELAHAEQFNHILLRQFDNDFSVAEKLWNSSYYSRVNYPNGYANYYKREAVAERLALSRLKINLGNLSAEVIEKANQYIKISRFEYQNILLK